MDEVFEARKEFSRDGYTKMSIDLYDLQHILQLAENMSSMFAPIFAVVGGRHDPKRLECELKEPSEEDEKKSKNPKKKTKAQESKEAEDTTKRELFNAVRIVIRRIDENWDIKKCSFLKSFPGGEHQEAHRDYSVEDVERSMKEYSSMPASVIVSLMPKTKIHVYRYSEDEISIGSKKHVDIEVGKCLIFRGDMPHGGVGYKSENIRLHFYIGHHLQEFEPGNTYPITFDMAKCKFPQCGRLYKTKSLARHHEARCRKNPDRAKVEAKLAKEKANNAITVRCNRCVKVHHHWKTYLACVREWNKKNPDELVERMKKPKTPTQEPLREPAPDVSGPSQAHSSDDEFNPPAPEPQKAKAPKKIPSKARTPQKAKAPKKIAPKKRKTEVILIPSSSEAIGTAVRGRPLDPEDVVQMEVANSDQDMDW